MVHPEKTRVISDHEGTGQREIGRDNERLILNSVSSESEPIPSSVDLSQKLAGALSCLPIVSTELVLPEPMRDITLK